MENGAVPFISVSYANTSYLSILLQKLGIKHSRFIYCILTCPSALVDALARKCHWNKASAEIENQSFECRTVFSTSRETLFAH